MPMVIAIDSDSLSQQDNRKLCELVAAAEFFQLPESIATPVLNADRFMYRVTVEAGERRHFVEVSESAVPSSLRPLLEWLTIEGRRRRGVG